MLEPVGNSLLVVVAPVPLLADAGEKEYLVVHRETEKHREQKDRDPAFDLGCSLEAKSGVQAVLEYQDKYPVGGAHRKQVEEHRLQRQDNRAERAQEQHVGEDQHRKDQPREGRIGGFDEVDTEGGSPGEDDLVAAGETGVGYVCVANTVHQRLGGFGP